MNKFAQALREELIGLTEIPRKNIEAELAAIAERSAQAKRTNKAAIALFHEVAATPGVHVGRVDGRRADGRFAASDE